ncbi:MAG: hypothetical protein RLY87_1335 [Chloroflexota bacterium]|jgi:hypothetical protein
MVRRLCMLCVAFWLLACGQSPAAKTDITPVFAFTEAVVGPNRLPLGIIQNGSPLNDPNAVITATFFNLDTDKTKPLGTSTAKYYGQGLPAAVYVATFDFPVAGNYGVQITTTTGAATSQANVQLTVLERAIAPKIGDVAMSVATLTNTSVADPKELSSAPVTDPSLYATSLDAALLANKPIAVLFATPGFCRTAVCGPSLKVFAELAKVHSPAITFIHSEIYRYPFGDSFAKQNEIFQIAMNEGRNLTDAERKTGVSDAYYAWKLQSEPWLFLIDSKGIIVGRYEGGLTQEELTPALTALK